MYVLLSLSLLRDLVYIRAGQKFWARVPKLSINFEEILSRGYRSWSLPKFLLIIPLLLMHIIIIVSLINNIIIIFLTKAFSRNMVRKNIWKQLALQPFLFWKEYCIYFVQCHVFAQSPSGGTAMINIQWALRTTLDLCENVSLAVLRAIDG